MVARNVHTASPRRVEGRFDRGAAAVEMALVMPLLILMVMGIIDFGRIFNGEIQLSQAAREGARIAALGTPGTFSLTDVTSRTDAALTNPALQGNPTFAAVYSSLCKPDADTLTGCIFVDVVQADGTALSGSTGVGRVCVAGESLTNYGQVTVTIPYSKILFGPDTLSQKAVMKCAG